MARLLVGNTWYEPVRPQSWFERDYEALVLAQAPDLFPAWQCVPFNETIVGEDGTRKKPDLALVDPLYRQWWVVEIELAHHDLLGHVIPQVDVFRSGSYEQRHAAALHRSAHDLDADRLDAMIQGDPPEVLVIVDSPSTEWRRPLLERRVSLAVVEPFRSTGTTIALRVNGDQPQPHPTMLSRCSRSQLRRLWKVHSPAALPPDQDTLTIEFDGVETVWSVLHLHDAVLLKPDHGDVLAGAGTVDLVLRANGGFAFRTVSRSTQSRRRPL